MQNGQFCLKILHVVFCVEFRQNFIVVLKIFSFLFVLCLSESIIFSSVCLKHFLSSFLEFLQLKLPAFSVYISFFIRNPQLVVHQGFDLIIYHLLIGDHNLIKNNLRHLKFNFIQFLFSDFLEQLSFRIFVELFVSRGFCFIFVIFKFG